MGVLLDSVRYPYFERVLTHTLLHAPADLDVLDVGCGSGSLSLEFARAGFNVTGVDPDTSAVEAARSRAARVDVSAQFDTAFSESLPYAASSFDVVVCSEVIEHVANVSAALDEICRVLRFGGVLLFSTPNRTILSKLMLIKFAQDWSVTRVMREIHHDFSALLKPVELSAQLAARGIDVYRIDGVIVPPRSLLSAVPAYLRFRMGMVPLAELASAVQLQVGRLQSLAYIGWGVKFG